MWIFLSDSMLSIVQAPRDRANLLVRARVRDDIRRVWPGADVYETPERDYRFRALISRRDVAEAIYAAVTAIDYGNFKDTVAENDRHNAYLGVWSAMNRLQERLTPRPEREEFWTHGRRPTKAKAKRVPKPKGKGADVLALDPHEVRRHIRPVG